MLDELTRHPGWPVLVDFMETRMAKDKLRVLNGNCQDFDAYRKLTGLFLGVHAVLDAPADVAKMVTTEKEIRGELEDREVR